MLRSELQQILKAVGNEYNPRKLIRILKQQVVLSSPKKETTTPSLMISTQIMSLSVASPTPGPGAYEIKQVQASNPKNKLGGGAHRSKMVCGGAHPGPGTYESIRTDRVDRLRSAPGVRIGKSVRPPLLTGTQLITPPPGTYEYQSLITEGPKMTIMKGNAYDQIERERKLVPGVGAYEPRYIPKQRAPEYRIGSSQRPSTSKQLVPAPGTYSLEMKPSTPQFSFGLEVRPSLARKTCAPGPGTHTPYYENVPAYVRNHKIYRQ